jgi:periplasmic protein TonB
MKPEQIMSSDLLDILFADRNKSYGAYALRREYGRRLQKSLLVTAAFVCAVLAVFYSSQNTEESGFVKTIVVDIPPMTDPRVPEPPKPPAPPAHPSPPVATVRDVVPVIVKDNVKPDPPPSIDDLINAQPGLETRAGIPAEGFPPPVVAGAGTATALPAAEPDNSIREKVDVVSSYPGGVNAWKRFLIKTFRYPTEAEQNGVAGTVLIKFVVDKNGKVSDIQALSGPDELRAEAIRVISRSGKWIPAMKNDSVVNSYKYQQIVFQLSE